MEEGNCQQPITHNIQAIKYYISNSHEPIPDITHQQVSIFSQLKFFLNDDELAIHYQNQSSQKIYILHEPTFQLEIAELYEKWMQGEKDKEEGDILQVKHRNFIAFTEMWVHHFQFTKRKFRIDYGPFDEFMRKEKQEADEVIKIEGMKEKLRIQIQAKQKKVAEIKKPNKVQREKKIEQYFKYFASKRQNVGHIQTFEELGIAYSTIDLSLWVQFARSFSTRKECEQLLGQEKYKQVSVRNLKKIFDLLSKDSKMLNFQQFRSALNKLYEAIFGKKYPESGEQELKFARWLHIDNQQNYRNKMKELGVYIPLNPTKMPKKVSNLKSIEARYLEHLGTSSSKHSTDSHTKAQEESTLLFQLKLNKQKIRPHEKITIPFKKQQLNSSPLLNLNKIRHRNVNKQVPCVDLEQILGLSEDRQNQDLFLDSYHHKASIGAVRRIDDRVQKYISVRQTIDNRVPSKIL